MIGGVPVLQPGGQRGEAPEVGGDPKGAGRGGSELAVTGSGQRADGEEGGSVPGTGGPDEAGMGRPHGGAGAHGGPR
jgi:hypothetical protein